MKPARCRTALVLLFLGAVALPSVERGVQAEVNYFPIPTVSTTKNDGSSAGLIVPTLITDQAGDLKYIVAPLFVVNTFVGAQGALNLFRYEPGGRELRLIASYSEKIERKLVFSYIDPAFSDGRYAITFGGAFFKNATSRFFGIGPQTTEADQTNYTAREIRANWKFGIHVNEVTQIAVGQRFREMRVQRGVTDLPFTAEVFPTVDGIDGANILGNRVTFHYDTRDNLVSPTDGTQITAYAELNLNFLNHNNLTYQRYELEIKKLFPSESKRLILVVRADLQATIGNEVPFYEQSSLGGQNNLRGYGVDRFIDDNLVVLNIEQRIHVLRTRMFNVAAEFEVAPFVDMGKVFSNITNRPFRNYLVTPGIGFRGIVRPSVVGRVDYGYSKEGGAVFAGLDFPF